MVASIEAESVFAPGQPFALFEGPCVGDFMNYDVSFDGEQLGVQPVVHLDHEDVVGSYGEDTP